MPKTGVCTAFERTKLQMIGFIISFRRTWDKRGGKSISSDATQERYVDKGVLESTARDMQSYSLLS